MQGSVAPSKNVGGANPIRPGKGAAAVNAASEKPDRIHPATWAAIIASTGFVLLLILLIALVFRGGGERQQAEKDQPSTVATQSVESASAPAPLASETPGQPKPKDRRQSSDTKSTELSAAQLYAKSSPSVVALIALNEKGQEIGSGTGFLLDESWISGRSESFDVLFDNILVKKVLAPALGVEVGPARNGCIVTNHHVIDAALTIKNVTLSDGSRGQVLEVIAESQEMDIAVLSAVFISEAPLTTLNLGDATPAVGSKVFAIGNPAGLTNSLSEGIVSGYRDISPGVQWLQTTAPISPGSSGGPLLLADGRVVGVTTAMLQKGQNLNFAVPSAEVQRFLKQPFVSRSLWEGRSYKKEESEALGFGSPLVKELLDGNDAKWKDAALTAVRSYNGIHFRGGQTTADELLRDASAALPSIPKEYRYLALYLQGIAHYHNATSKIDPRTMEKLRASFAGNHHYRQAVSLFEQVVRECPDFSPAYAWLAECRVRGGEWAEGLLAADSLVKLVPRCADAYMHRGYCFEELGRANSALHDFQTAAKLDPKHENVWNSLGRVYASFGEYDKAIEAYETEISGLPETTQSGQTTITREVMASMSYYHIGCAHERAGRYEQAIKFFELSKAGYVSDWRDEQIRKCRAKMR
jgi:S1-C subfamily serine protease